MNLDDLNEAERDDAREFIRAVLFDLAQSDGQRSSEEDDVFHVVTRVWARH